MSKAQLVWSTVWRGALWGLVLGSLGGILWGFVVLIVLVSLSSSFYLFKNPMLYFFLTLNFGILFGIPSGILVGASGGMLLGAIVQQIHSRGVPLQVYRSRITIGFGLYGAIISLISFTVVYSFVAANSLVYFPIFLIIIVIPILLAATATMLVTKRLLSWYENNVIGVSENV